ncbi:MBL fold hydrolase [Stutzerimonas kirkiae]|uniref:MBL fold hydrolase n=1 Tax=Stutzerimonas kirkiae TaxID=2211392 RepID=A0A4Q9QZR9_9GAMM|nr:MBL fold metallo-hydrolase [Stutzerimonas kirkiae]TBU91629.1 MBL fold hydrolase [Stutzerimonas kirkiae]TBV00645.1 MBL fold hydrolase [Stutzerimonas kirkiae]
MSTQGPAQPPASRELAQQAPHAYPVIVHRGATSGVTGSCHQLHFDENHSLLVDCGLFQGDDAQGHGDGAAIDFPIDTVKALIVTHVHIDHIGRIPQLLAAGFKGPIYCTPPSARLLPIALEDAFRLQISRDRDTLQRYLQLIAQRLVVLDYDHWHSPAEFPPGQFRLRLQRAGHILGSAYVEIALGAEPDGQRILFSGDIGAPHAPLLMPPRSPERADIMVLESTYGDRLHEGREHRRERLAALIEQALDDQGTVLIPAFSVGRTQELLYELEDIIHQAGAPERVTDTLPDGSRVDWPRLPVILDSPLASRFTQAYRELQPWWNEEARLRQQAGRKPLAFEQLIKLDSHADHQRILAHLGKTARPAIVIAGAGMCTGGRIVEYLKAMLGDPRHNVLFVGYQSPGTPGHDIQRYGPKGGYVYLDRQRFDIRAGIASIGGYSAHADQADLLRFVSEGGAWPREIRLVHGEEQAKRQLAAALGRLYREQGRPVEVVTP